MDVPFIPSIGQCTRKSRGSKIRYRYVGRDTSKRIYDMKGTVIGSCEDGEARNVVASSAAEAGKGEGTGLRGRGTEETVERRSRRYL